MNLKIVIFFLLLIIKIYPLRYVNEYANEINNSNAIQQIDDYINSIGNFTENDINCQQKLLPLDVLKINLDQEFPHYPEQNKLIYQHISDWFRSSEPRKPLYLDTIDPLNHNQIIIDHIIKKSLVYENYQGFDYLPYN